MEKKRIEMLEKYSAQNLVADSLDIIIRKLDNAVITGKIPTGFGILDKYIDGGICPGQLLTIAARPSIGKTSFIVSMIRNMIRDDKKILFFSLQLSSYSILARLIAGISNVSLRNIRVSDFHYSEDNELSRVISAADYLYSKSFHIIDLPMISISELKEIASTAIEMDLLDCILIDDINLIDMKADSSAERYRKIAKELKELAIELKIPVVAIMRYPRDRKERTPSAAYVFPEAKFIMRESDIFLFLHRKRILTEDEKEKNAKDSYGNAVFQAVKVICARNRKGDTGTFLIGYNAKTCSFENIVQDVCFIEP